MTCQLDPISGLRDLRSSFAGRSVEDILGVDDEKKRRTNMATEMVNLRASGTDSSNAAAGKLVGTATIEVPDQRFPNDESWIAPLISCEGRLFRLASSSFAGYGAAVTPEYIEVAPVKATPTWNVVPGA
jgi:hypothetical protein